MATLLPQDDPLDIKWMEGPRPINAPKLLELTGAYASVAEGAHWRYLKPGNPFMLPTKDCRIEDVPNWIAIMPACRLCLRASMVQKGYLSRRFGERKTFREIEVHLCCSRCGQRGRNRFFFRAIPRD